MTCVFNALLWATRCFWVRLVLHVCVVLAVVPVFAAARAPIALALQWVDTTEHSAVVYTVFAAVYVLQCVLALPVVANTVAAGALFGFLRGGAVAYGAMFVGCMLAYTVGQTTWYFFRRNTGRSAACGVSAAARLARHTASVLRQLLGSDHTVYLLNVGGGEVLFLLRVLPVTAYNILNYDVAAANMSGWDVVAATALGIVPGVVSFVSLGAAAGKVLRALEGGAALSWVLLVYGVGIHIAVAAASSVVAVLARKRMHHVHDTHIAALTHDIEMIEFSTSPEHENIDPPDDAVSPAYRHNPPPTDIECQTIHLQSD